MKRSVLTEAHGVPVGIVVSGANCPDMKLVQDTIERVPVDRPQPTEDAPQGMCMDKGYDYAPVRDTIEQAGFTAHIRSRGEEAEAKKHKRGSKPRRWVVERTHSWMNRFRRILIRWQKKDDNYLAFLHFACALIALRAAGLFG